MRGNEGFSIQAKFNLIHVIIQNKFNSQQMDFFRGLVKNVYDNVVQDDYIEPLSESQLYHIMQKSRRKLSTQNSDGRKMSFGLPETDIISKIENMGHVTPERQFRILGPDPRFEIVTGRVKELKEDLDEVKEIMMQNFPRYKSILNNSINEMGNLQSFEKGRSQSKMLKQKLGLLEFASKRSKKITFLNIKIKNIKSTLKILSEVPQIKKMSLYELKSINIPALRSKQTINRLLCLQSLESFIESAVSKQLGLVVHILEECLVRNFSQQMYEKALKNFIIADHEKIKYERLLIKLVQKEIRKGDTEIGTNIYQICLFYIKIMINLHNVFRWHRSHEHENEWKYQKNQNQIANIHLELNKVKSSIIEVMDECLKDLVIEKFYRCEQKEMLEIVYLVQRISSICKIFSGNAFTQTIEEMKVFIQKKMTKLKEKSMNQLRETLALEEMNKWNRLPVPNDYSHDPVDRNLFKIKRHKESENYKQMPMHEMVHIDQKSQGLLNGKNIQENWQIKQLTLPEVDKFEKYRNEVKISYDSEVVICQTSLTIIKYMDSFASYAFYFPLVSTVKKAVEEMFFLTEFYIYYVFMVFASSPLKNAIFESFQIPELKYSQKRISVLYSNLFHFLKNFRKQHNYTFRQGNDTKEGQNFIRLRVVALQSIFYITAYLQHILNLIDRKQTVIDRLQRLRSIQSQCNETVFSDSIPKICKIENTEGLIQKIRWTEDYHHIRQYLGILLNNFQQFYFKMRAVNKGEVPLPIIDKIFALYWKTQLTVIVKVFLTDFRPGRNFTLNPKTVFEKFIDDMYEGVKRFINDPQPLFPIYEKIKGIFPILLQTNWEKAWEVLKESLKNFQFVYKIEINLMTVSECTCYLSTFEVNGRKKMVEQWINETLLGE